jgi:hypothetical protein
MRFGYSLSFPVRDSHWFRKVFLPACLLLVPVLGPLVALGWGFEVCRRVVGRQTEELPDLDFGRNASDGLRLFAILLIYCIPLFVTAGLGVLVASPFFLSEQDTAAATVASVLCGTECAVLLIALAEALLLSAAIGHCASEGNFRKAFRLGEVIRLLRAAPAAYLLAILAYFPLAVLGLLGSLICLVGLFFTEAYFTASAFHLIGQAYLAAQSRREPPAAPTAAP